MRQFVGINLLAEDVPDATTLLKFRHQLESNGITRQLFSDLGQELVRSGKMVRGGTIVDATIFEAQSSTKNERQERDPEMHQTKKGNQWCFGMKGHIGVNADSGLGNTVEATAANVHDVVMAEALLHGEETDIYGDSGYTGLEDRSEMKENHPDAKCHTARRPSAVKRIADGSVDC